MNIRQKYQKSGPKSHVLLWGSQNLVVQLWAFACMRALCLMILSICFLAQALAQLSISTLKFNRKRRFFSNWKWSFCLSKILGNPESRNPEIWGQNTNNLGEGRSLGQKGSLGHINKKGCTWPGGFFTSWSRPHFLRKWASCASTS